MTSAVQPSSADRSDVRTILAGGVQLGVLTAVGVVAFALLSRALAGAAEVIAQSLVILVGGVVCSALPARAIRPRSTDGIAWATMIGLLGALAFTVCDVVLLRPIHLYSWRWDAIGGGSGFWYLPVWWMGSAFVAWLGAWVVAIAARRGREPGAIGTALVTAGIAVVLFAVATATRALPFHGAAAALAFGAALVLHVPLAAAVYRR